MYRVSAVLVFILIVFQSQSGATNKEVNPIDSKSKIIELKRDIEEIISDKSATVGVSIATDECEILTLNPDTHFPLMSVFKFHIALAVLDKLDKNQTPLDSLIFIEKSKLSHNTYSPMIKKFPNQNLTLSIGELIVYCVSHSDNNACDLLINYVGGIHKVEEYIMKLGVRDLRLTVTERMMHDNIMKQYDNWSTPQSAISLMKIFVNTSLFAQLYKDFLIGAMTDTTTGKNKLKAMLPETTVVAHKTGSSNRTDGGVQIAENDIAFIYLPNGKRYYISVFVKDSKETDSVNVGIIARVSKVVYDFLMREF